VIKRFEKLKSLGMFSNFVWDSRTPDFKKVNIIYGPNGSGKTTLTNILRLFSIDIEKTEKENILSKIKNNPQPAIEILLCNGKKLKTPVEEKILVFNSSFVGDHVYEGYNVKLKEFKSGVVTKEQLKNPKIKKIENEITKIEEEKKKIENALRDLENIAKHQRSELSKKWNKNIKGLRLPANLDLSRIDKIPDLPPKQELNELEEKLEEHFKKFKISKKQDEVLKDISKISTIQLKGLVNEINIEQILNKKIVQNAISQVEKKLEELKSVNLKHNSIQDWFEDGVILLNNLKDKNICPLCGSKINVTQIINSYNAFFNNEFEILKEELESLQDEISQNIDKINIFNSLKIELEQILNKYELSLKDEKFEILKSSVFKDTVLKKMQAIIEKKEKDVNYLATKSDLKLINNYKNVINNFNIKLPQILNLQESVIKELKKISFDEKEAKTTVKNLFWKNFDEEAKSFIEKFYKDEEGGNNRVNFGGIKFYWWLQNKNKELNKKLSELQKNKMVLLAELKNESKYVNNFLKRLSISNFEIKINEEHGNKDIEIIYNTGSIKKGMSFSLSEGEKTALAFAYFLSKIQYEICKNRYENLNQYIIVIDDPVSSLDENRLFSTALLIKNMFSENAKQLFIFSHNLIFLKFFSNILSKNTNEVREDYYLENGKLLPLPSSLRNYQTSYFYKIRKIQDFISGKIDYETAKEFLPNHIRIVLEVFLSFKLCRLKQGSSNKKYKTPGLKELISSLRGINLQRFQNVNSITSDNIINTLCNIKNKIDPESHGTIQDLTNFEFISENELKEIAQQTLDIIAFLDEIHYEKVSNLS